MDDELYALMRQRGHLVTKIGDKTDIFVPNNIPLGDKELLEGLLFRLMLNDNFRISLRKWMYDEKLTNVEATRVEAFIKVGCNIDKAFNDYKIKNELNRSRYANTFEWFISELIKRKFAARAVGYGIRTKDATPDDEFDVAGIIDDGLIYCECKTGKETLFNGLKTFAKRDRHLEARYSLFLFDRKWQFNGQNNNLTDLTREEINKLGIYSIYEISKSKTTFYEITINDRWFLACSDLEDIENKVRHMLRYTHSKNNSDGRPEGFNIETVEFKPEAK